MKPILLESGDSEALQALGRASVQIVHDLKNQLNGLKLYATFLRKRLEKTEKTERAAEELETINKLIAGLDRTAADLSLIVDYAHPVELKKRPETDLQTIVRDVAARINSRPPTTGSLAGPVVVATQPAKFIGEFNPVMLAQALESISVGALRMLNTREGTLEIQLKSEAIATRSEGVIEWPLPESFDHDPFHSFAGSNEIRLSLAARIIEAHGGSAERRNGAMCVRLPLRT